MTNFFALCLVAFIMVSCVLFIKFAVTFPILFIGGFLFVWIKAVAR